MESFLLLEISIVSGVFLAFAFLNYRSDYVLPKWWFFSVFSGALLSLNLYEYSIPFAVLIFYMITLSATKGKYQFSEKRNEKLMFESLQSLSSIVACATFFIFMPLDIITLIFENLWVPIFVNAAYGFLPQKLRMVKGYRNNTYPVDGIGANTSVNATIQAILLGTYLSTLPTLPMSLMAIVASTALCIRTKGIAGSLGVLFASIAWAMFHSIIFAVIFALTAFALLFPKWRVHFSPSWRDQIWKDIYEFMNGMRKAKLYHLLIFGVGFGGFRATFPSFQKLYKTEMQGFATTRAHNDLFQFIFEGGLIGSLILFWFIGSLVPQLQASDWIFISALVPSIMFNFPFHLAFDVSVVLMFLKTVFTRPV